jgi:hypothetical protein
MYRKYVINAVRFSTGNAAISVKNRLKRSRNFDEAKAFPAVKTRQLFVSGFAGAVEPQSPVALVGEAVSLGDVRAGVRIAAIGLP